MKKYDEVSVVRQLNNVGAVIGINSASKVIKVAKIALLVMELAVRLIFFLIIVVIMLRLLMLFNNKKNVMKKLLLRKLLKRLLVKLSLQKIILLKVLLVLLINVCVLLKESSMLWLALNSHLEL